MTEAEEMLEEYRRVLTNLFEDRDALLSPQWKRIQHMIGMRRELLREFDENATDEGATMFIRKGRIQEAKTIFNMLEDIETGIPKINDYVKELTVFVQGQKTQDEQGET